MVLIDDKCHNYGSSPVSLPVVGAVDELRFNKDQNYHQLPDLFYFCAILPNIILFLHYCVQSLNKMNRACSVYKKLHYILQR